MRKLLAMSDIVEEIRKDRGRDFKWMVHIYAIAMGILAFDQLTKWIVTQTLEFRLEELNVIDGFFRFVHWGNTGSAFSLFQGNNAMLALVAVVALVAMYWMRSHFEIHRPLGRWAMGVITGGILGNLLDRLLHNHVIDFLYFYTYRRIAAGDPPHAMEVGFPAFNVADSAICTGIGLIFLMAALDGKRSDENPMDEKRIGEAAMDNSSSP
jgi:signal peptidase II